MEQVIIKIFKNLGIIYFHDLSDKNLEIIYNLFLNNKIPDNPTGIIYYYLGVYYYSLKIIPEMVKNYKIAIKNNILLAANNLAYYYQRNGNSKSKVEKYYQIGIKSDNWIIYSNYAEYLAGCCPRRISEANQYYLLSVKSNNPQAQNFYGIVFTKYYGKLRGI